MTDVSEFPRTKAEAAAQGVTYFMASRKCSVHGTRFYWADSGKCMGCYDPDGQRRPVLRTPFKRKPKVKEIADA